jgi:hypothetical protein
MVVMRRAMAEVAGRAVVGTPKDHGGAVGARTAFLVDKLDDHLAGRAALAFPSPAAASCATATSGATCSTRPHAGVDDVTPH